MILRLESMFLQTTNKLGNPFSEENKENLARLVENNFNKIRNAITLQEQLKEEYKPAVIELGKIGKNIFSLSIYYRRDDMGDDIPMSIRECCQLNPQFVWIYWPVSLIQPEIQRKAI